MADQISIPLNIALFGNIGSDGNSDLLSNFGYVLTDATDPDVIADHCARAVELLIEQFEKKPNITGMLCVFVKQLQELEYELSDLLLLRLLENASGAQLDGIGDIVGIDRLGLNDTDYKALIYFQIFVNAGQGTPDQTSLALKFLTQASEVHLSEFYPGAVELTTDGALIPDDLYRYMQGIVPAGVRIESITRVPSNPFIMASVSVVPTEGGGFSNTSQLVGGSFAGLVTT